MISKRFKPRNSNWEIIAVDEPRSIHLVPVDDTEDHCDEDCPCRPTFEGDTASGPAYSHHSFDGREAFEHGARKLS